MQYETDFEMVEYDEELVRRLEEFHEDEFASKPEEEII